MRQVVVARRDRLPLVRDFANAGAMYRSRAMNFGPNGLTLIPVLDMANHDRENNNIASFEIERAAGAAYLPLQ